jgi:hypothetical protein
MVPLRQVGDVSNAGCKCCLYTISCYVVTVHKSLPGDLRMRFSSLFQERQERRKYLRVYTEAKAAVRLNDGGVVYQSARASRHRAVLDAKARRVSPLATLAIFSWLCCIAFVLVSIGRRPVIRIPPLLWRSSWVRSIWHTWVLNGADAAFLVPQCRICVNPCRHWSRIVLSIDKFCVVLPRAASRSVADALENLFCRNISIAIEQRGVAKNIHKLIRNLVNVSCSHFYHSTVKLTMHISSFH